MAERCGGCRHRCVGRDLRVHGVAVMREGAAFLLMIVGAVAIGAVATTVVGGEAGIIIATLLGFPWGLFCASMVLR